MVTKNSHRWKTIKVVSTKAGGLDGVVVEFLPPTSEAAGSNLGPGTSC